MKKIRKNFTFLIFLFLLSRVINYCIFYNYTEISVLKNFYIMKKEENFNEDDFNKNALLNSCILWFLISGVFGLFYVAKYLKKESANILNENISYSNKSNKDKNNLLIITEKNVIYFNKFNNKFEILVKNFLYSIPGIIVLIAKDQIRINQISKMKKIKLPFYIYLLMDFFFYSNLGFIFFGYGIIRIIKNNYEEQTKRIIELKNSNEDEEMGKSGDNINSNEKLDESNEQEEENHEDDDEDRNSAIKEENENNDSQSNKNNDSNREVNDIYMYNNKNGNIKNKDGVYFYVKPSNNVNDF